MEKNLNEKICIVGGGPAGLSAGMYLEKKGYKNYTILEKEDVVGGKCFSPEYKGKRYEMGAIMGVPCYYAVQDVMDFCGITPDGPRLDRQFRTKEGKLYNPFTLFKGLKLKSKVKKLGNLLETKYKGYDKNGHLGTHPDMMMPFHDFCVMNGVEEIEAIWMNPGTAFGYGFFDEIPAAYMLKYLDMPTAIAFVQKRLWTWKDGTQSIWEKLNAKLAHPAVMNTNITKVTRTNGKVQVTTDKGTEEYDKIIITSPLQYMDKYFDATEEEKKYFSKIIYEDYKVFAYTVKKYPEISCYVPDNMVPSRLGHLMVYYERWDNCPDQIITAYCLGNHSNGTQLTTDQCRDLVTQDMKTLGVEPDQVVYERSWYYFPHLSCENYKSGWYEDVESWQGNRNTYYAGEVMSFGDMDETAQYSKELVERFF
ncbi:MAG: FAD-dependent oxidoreductase [Oscillospiraceae bacterium]